MNPAEKLVPASQNPQATEPTIGRALKVDWNQFPLREDALKSLQFNRTLTMKCLKNSQLACANDSEAQQWVHRRLFIDQVVADILTHCPKEEPLTLISLGSERLLVEFIIGKTLLDHGFQHLSFLLVDSCYVFSSPEQLKVYQETMQEFREKITSDYHRHFKEPLPDERIKFLPHAQNVNIHFKPQSNVVLIESLPPYSEAIKEIAKQPVVKKSPEDLMMGNIVLPTSLQANSIALIPKNIINKLSAGGSTLYDLPVCIMRNQVLNSFFYIDWGCKIAPDGTYRLSFTGHEDYIDILGIDKTRKITIANGTTITLTSWIPALQQAIREQLDKEIKKIKGESSHICLSQEQISALLEGVKQTTSVYLPGSGTYFFSDYLLNRQEGLKFISTHASHHYRKNCRYTADAENGFKITIEDIAADRAPGTSN